VSKPTQLAGYPNYDRTETIQLGSRSVLERTPERQKSPTKMLSDRHRANLQSPQTLVAPWPEAEAFFGNKGLKGGRSAKQGGAKPTTIHSLGDHYRMFVLIEVAIWPVTGSNWEGTGCPPDVEVAPDAALAKALKLAKASMAEATPTC
jgi:hypothetical protein